jgi:SAM-dependent methyltransferase
MTTRDHTDVGAYYDQEPVEMAEATGAGLIWFMGRDHLSPPLSNDDIYALNSSNWRQASSERVVGLAQRMDMNPGQIALELGCGIGGPGRDIAQATDASVVGLSVSINQLCNLRRISHEVESPYTMATKGDMQRLPFGDKTFDHVYSINAIYHVDNPGAVIDEGYRVLDDGGQFGVDDWFVTDATTDEQLASLRKNWSTSSHGFHNIDAFSERMQQTGFTITEVTNYTKEAGEFLNEDRFGTTYDMQVAPVLLDAFPKLYQYDGYESAHAQMAVDQLRSDILYMGELYRTGSATYRQIIAQK